MLVGLLMAAVVSEAAGVAAAARADEHADPETVRLIADAVAEYDVGRFEEARALFRAAHARTPTARTLRGIGMASFELRDYVEATRALGQALQDKRRPLTDEQRRQVEALLQRAQTFVGRFTPHVQPVDAELLIDGQPARREDGGAVLAPFGRHRFTARCAACVPPEKTVEVNVTGGERADVEITLAPAAAPPVAEPDASRAPVALLGSSDTRPDSSSAHRDEPVDASAGSGPGTPALWLAGTSVAAILGAGVGALWWHDRQHELDACRSAADAGDRCTTESSISTQRNAAIGVTVGLGVAGIALGTTAAILWSRPADQRARAVACMGGIGAVSCAIRF